MFWVSMSFFAVSMSVFLWGLWVEVKEIARMRDNINIKWD